MKLCAVIRPYRTKRIPGVSPAAWVIQEATLEVEPPEWAPHLHADGRTDTHYPLPVGVIRVCVPLTMVQETLELAIGEEPSRAFEKREPQSFLRPPASEGTATT